jgi:beta-glucosidase
MDAMRKSIHVKVIAIVIFLASALQAQAPELRLGKNSIKEIIAAMTLEEKAAFVVGAGTTNFGGPVVGNTSVLVQGAAGTTRPIERFGITAMALADGPAGLRISPKRANDANTYYCTAFPVATLLASTWDVGLVKEVGAAMGNEVLEYGADILLAPALNIHRNPLCGRNFEYYSEDPLIAGKMAAAIVAGVQSQGVGTSIKHFAANNQEANRMNVNANISERALREIYLEGFRIAVQESQPWTVMSSYNKINGVYTSESYDLLSKILKGDWGFKGLVMTDWFGGRDAVAQMTAGNDLLMPGSPDKTKVILSALQNGVLDVKVLDKNIENILGILLKTPRFKGYKYSNKPDLKAHAQVSRHAASEGMVLLKNEQSTLPLTKSVQNVALFGNASYEILVGGTGSGDVNRAYTISLMDGLKAAGLSADESLKGMYDDHIKQAKAKQPQTGRRFGVMAEPLPEMPLEPGIVGQTAVKSGVAIITISRSTGEGADRKLEGNYLLSDSEKLLIKTVSEAFHAKGKKAIVLLNIGGVIETASWKNLPDAILLVWQPGQEAGYAIADVLSGKVNPSGKIASTFPVDYGDMPSAKNFPGVPANNPAEVNYEEGIYVGYRYFNTFAKKTSYEFGYGQSYTSFAYGKPKLSSKAFSDKIVVSIPVKNVGKAAGKEIVQIYLGAPAKKMHKPESELKAFGKTRLLQPGESQLLTFSIAERNLASFDTDSSSWVAEAGTYVLKIGASSIDIRQTASFTLAKDTVVEKNAKACSPKTEINELLKK